MLLGNSLHSVGQRHEVKAMSARLPFQSILSVPVVISLKNRKNAVVIGLTACEHVVNNASQFVSCGGDGLWSSESCSHSTVERS